MKTPVIALLGVVAFVSMANAQQPQTITDSGGNKLTFSTAGVTLTTTDGSSKQLSGAWLNENCQDLTKAGLTDPNDLAAMKSVCADWSKFNDQGGEAESILEAPKAIPDDCPISESVSVSINGQSDAYKILAYQIAALDAGHEGQLSALLAMKLMKDDPGADPTAMLADVFRNLDVATNKFRCGAYFAGQYQSTRKEGQIAIETSISVYNRLAIINERMKEYTENRFRDPANPDTNTVLNNANELAKLIDLRKAALSDLLNATEMSALLSIYTGDKSATVADTLDMSSAERNQLLIQLDQILKSGSPDDFTQNADLLKGFLIKHPKVHD